MWDYPELPLFSPWWRWASWVWAKTLPIWKLEAENKTVIYTRFSLCILGTLASYENAHQGAPQGHWHILPIWRNATLRAPRRWTGPARRWTRWRWWSRRCSSLLESRIWDSWPSVWSQPQWRRWPWKNSFHSSGFRPRLDPCRDGQEPWIMCWPRCTKSQRGRWTDRRWWKTSTKKRGDILIVLSLKMPAKISSLSMLSYRFTTWLNYLWQFDI